MLGHQHSTQYFPRFHQMMQVSAAPGPAYGAAAPFIKRPLVLGKAGIADVQRSAPGKGLPVASAARRQHAIEHVDPAFDRNRSEEHTSELQSLMRISYAVFCLKKKNYKEKHEELRKKITINKQIKDRKINNEIQNTKKITKTNRSNETRE